jgi:hypothetical protein
MTFSDIKLIRPVLNRHLSILVCRYLIARARRHIEECRAPKDSINDCPAKDQSSDRRPTRHPATLGAWAIRVGGLALMSAKA